MPEINRVLIRGSNPVFKWRPTQSWMLVGHCGDVPGTNIDAEQTATTVLLDYESYCDSYAVRILACAVFGVLVWEGNDCDLRYLAVYSNNRVCMRVAQGFTSAAYLAWIKQHIQNGHPVLIGVFINQFMDHNDTVRFAVLPVCAACMTSRNGNGTDRGRCLRDSGVFECGNPGSECWR